MFIFKKSMQASLIGLIFMSCAQTSLAGGTNFWNLFHGAPKIKSENGNYWKLRGRVLWDISDLSETRFGGGAATINDSEFRSARIGFEGSHSAFKYKAEIDMSGSKMAFKDANITWRGPVDIKVGQMKAGGSIEEMSSSRHIALMERGMTTDAFGFDRRLGVQIAISGEHYGLSAGLYGNSINGSENGAPSNTVWAARGYWNTNIGESALVHMGTSLRRTDKAIGAPKHSARWGAHLAKEKIKPKIGANALLHGIEAATIMGPFHGHAEYLREDGDTGSAKGGFVQAGYFLTGESRRYKSGSFNRTKPSKPLSKGGLGGWEIIGRFDTLDARKAGDEQADAYTLGMTWYPESHLRVKLNYTNASADTYEADGLSMRLQMDW